jgi:hypothetical protein
VSEAAADGPDWHTGGEELCRVKVSQIVETHAAESCPSTDAAEGTGDRVRVERLRPVDRRREHEPVLVDINPTERGAVLETLPWKILDGSWMTVPALAAVKPRMPI